MSHAMLEAHVRIIEHSLRLQRASTPEEFARSCDAIRVSLAALAELPKPCLGELALSPLQLHALFVLTAIELSPAVAALAREVGAYASDMPTLEGLRRLLHNVQADAASTDVLSPRGALRRLALIERADDGSPHSHESNWTWSVARRVLSELRGVGELDVELADAISFPDVSVDPPTVDSEASAQVDSALGATSGVVVVSGPSSVGKRSLVRSLARSRNLRLLNVDVTRLGPDLARQLRLLARECAITGALPLFENLTADHADVVGRAFAPLHAGLILVTCGVHRPALKCERPVVVVEVPPATTAQRAALWKRSLKISDADARTLAERYSFAPGFIVTAAAAARARAQGDKLSQDHVYAGIRAVLDDKLGQYAKRVRVSQTWDDLVLPREQLDPIIELIARVRGRTQVYEQWGFAAKVGKGLGVSALFSGPPGTGKTMVAALIAKELGLELYQVDMARLVSKYIGATEKHLAAMFDAAEAGHAILFFDECDSLFGKRTEVRSSNDRYANLETNYLLQRLESFTGICLLTTNHEANMDPAFHRRLSLHVRFDLPDEGERARLWRAVLPTAAPLEAVEFKALASKYMMSGGNIRNAALRAAFLAADEGGAITAAHLERAARVEYEGMGKLASS